MDKGCFIDADLMAAAVSFILDSIMPPLGVRSDFFTFFHIFLILIGINVVKSNLRMSYEVYTERTYDYNIYARFISLNGPPDGIKGADPKIKHPAKHKIRTCGPPRIGIPSL